MAIQAKIASATQSVAKGVEQTVVNTVAVPPGGNIALALHPGDIANYTRDGKDLVVHLKSGETLRITDFFADPQAPSHLYLVNDDQQLVSADFGQVASDGSLTATYVPQALSADFAGVAAGTAAAGAGHGIGLLAILGGVAAAGGVAAVVSSGGGHKDSDPPNNVTPVAADTTPPVAASNLAISRDGTTLTGTAEAGAKVGIDTNADGKVDQTVTAGANGTFTATLNPPLTNGQTVTVVVTDAAGNTGPSATVHAPDTTPPLAASDLIISADGATLTGHAEAGATVGIDTNGDGQPDQTVTAGADGTFTATLNPALTNGETITVVATDAAGNTGPSATVLAPDTTPPLAASDLVISADGTTLTGHAEVGASVGIDTNGDGQPDQTVTAGADGTFTATLTPPLTNGETVTVVVTDPAGNPSPPATVTAADITPPLAASDLVISADGTTLTGHAEAGATVGIDTDGDSQPDQTVTAGADGTFTATLSPALIDGETVTVIVTDHAGNTGPSATVLAPDLTPTPGAPTIDPSNGTILTGTALAGSTVTLTDGNHAPIGQTNADANGHWSFTPQNQLADGTVVTAIATNSGGDSGPSTSITIDGVAPAAPVIEPTNGTEVHGTAEAGSVVTLTDGNGAPIGQVTADGNGNWSLTITLSLGDGTVVHAVAQDAAGNDSLETVATVDAIAPTAPTIAASNGAEFHGTAEADSTVVLVDGNGTFIGQAVADSLGHWSVTPGSATADGTTVTATAQDAAGNVSLPASTTVDSVPPDAPVLAHTNGSVVHGMAEAGSTVTLTDGNNVVIGQATADGNGDWSFTPNTPLPDGSVVHAVAQDAAGNVSPSASMTVDSSAPAAPVIDPSNGITIHGLAEAGATIIVFLDGTPTIIGQTTADSNGNWSITPGAPLPDGTVVRAYAQDAAENLSGPGFTTVDAVAPTAPVITPTNGHEIQGTAEAGSTVILTDGTGNSIGTATADINGVWSFTPATPLADSTVIHAVAQDAAKNDSPIAAATVDALPPGTPTVEPTNGIFIHGTAEAFSTVVLTDGNGNAIGTTTADSSGNWGFQQSPPSTLPDGTTINVIAQDAAGNTSAPASTIVDSIAPAAPTIAPTNGTELHGTAEAGSTVDIFLSTFDPSGLLGTVTADANGNWSLTLDTQLLNGDAVGIISKDAAGNTSPPATTVVDTIAPNTPVIAPTDGHVIHGTAEAFSTVILTDGAGNSIATVTADSNGVWSFTPATPLADSTVVHAVAQDAAKNDSSVATATVDAVRPGTPTVEPTNGIFIHGTAEAFSTVVLTDSNHNVIGTTTADSSGNWGFQQSPPSTLPDGTTINVIAQDAAGNISSPASTIVDSIAPVTPTIALTNGTELHGTAEAGAIVGISDLNGLLGTVTADANGNWSFTPDSPLADGDIVGIVTQDAAGNTSPGATVVVDARAPDEPIIAATNGHDLHGTAEAFSTVTLTDGAGNPIHTVTADMNGNWSFTPPTPLPDGTTIHAVATDAVGNTSQQATATVDAVAPAAPDNMFVTIDGGFLVGHAEANSTVTIYINNDTASSITTQADINGQFFLPLIPALLTGETIFATATDAAGNVSPPGSAIAPNFVPPTVTVQEAADGYVNGAELSDGIQASVGLPGSVHAGDVVNVVFTGQNGATASISHTVTAQDVVAGHVDVSLVPSGGTSIEGTASVVATINGGPVSLPADFTVDTIPPATPVLSLLGDVLTISSEPSMALNVVVSVGGLQVTDSVTADNSGITSLNLLNGLGTQFTWDQLLNAQISVQGADQAGNQSPIANIGINSLLALPSTIGGLTPIFSVLSPLALGLGGTADPNSELRVTIGALGLQANVTVTADSTGHFVINLLDPNVLGQLGGNVSLLFSVLNPGSVISFDISTLDTNGNVSSHYGTSIGGNGLSVSLGEIALSGDAGDNILTARDGNSEHILAGAGHDLILHVGSGDIVGAGDGNDTIQIVQNNFGSIDGGNGFDTLLFSNGVNINYGTGGTGTLTNIERIDMGKGDAGSTLTLNAAQVAAITDGNHTLQITGDSNDTLNVSGALDTHSSQTVGGLVYDVYSYGTSTLLVEHNTVQVHP